MTAQSLDTTSVIEAWERSAQQGEGDIHPLDPEGQEYWDSGRAQAAQVADYAKDGATVIDYGCGNGRLTIPLVQAGYKTIAVDASQTMLNHLDKRCAQFGVDPSAITKINSGGADLATQLGKKKADVILIRAVLIHHDYAGVEQIVTDVAKCLKKGGHLIADWPLADNPGERGTWISVTTWNPAHRLQVAERAGLVPVHVGDEPSVWVKA